jgi:hypothetical protein
MEDLIRNVGYNLVSGAVVLVVGYAWFYFWPRRKEAEWITQQGVLFYAYFRTVDWRCKKLSEYVDQGATTDRARFLRRELTKLKADLECLDWITELWSDRVAAFPVWYPYSQRVSELLSATSLLTLSLNRHIEPQLWYLSQSAEGVREQKDFDDYAAYFLGGIERFWSTPVDSNETPWMHAIQERGRLSKRLEAVLIPLLGLLRTEAHCEPDDIKRALPGWDSKLDHSVIWFPTLK